jgi:hypothetical protein
MTTKRRMTIIKMKKTTMMTRMWGDDMKLRRMQMKKKTTTMTTTMKDGETKVMRRMQIKMRRRTQRASSQTFFGLIFYQKQAHTRCKNSVL